MKKVLLIIPVYNEEASLEKTIKTIEDYKLRTKLSFKLDYVIINDGSVDKTASILDQRNFKHIDLIQNIGIGGAVQTGYLYAKKHDYDVAIQFDGDGQHDIEYLDNIVEPIFNGEADFAIGSRFIEKGASEFRSTVFRRAGIKLISMLIKIISGQIVYDTTSGFRAGNKDVIKYFSKRYPVNYPEPESIVHLKKNKFRIKEYPVNMKMREEGESSISALKSITYMIEVISSIIISGFMRGTK